MVERALIHWRSRRRRPGRAANGLGRHWLPRPFPLTNSPTHRLREAPVGIEPTIADLQSVTHQAINPYLLLSHGLAREHNFIACYHALSHVTRGPSVCYARLL